MSTPDFEVIVVGAGPAGAMLTKELAKRRISVLCIEKEAEVGYPNKSTAGTPVETFELFDIPTELSYSAISGLRLYGPSEYYEVDFDSVFGRIMKFREVKQYLIKEAIKLGASIMVGTEAIDFLNQPGKNPVVKIKGFNGQRSLTANVVVDATGPESLFAFKLGLMPANKSSVKGSYSIDYFLKPGVGGAFEYFMDNAKPEKAKNGFFLDIFMGSKYSPGGYSWIFPTGDHQVKAGVCKMDPSYKMPGEKSQIDYFQKLWDENPQIQNAQPFELHMCPYRHWVIGGLKSATLDNFIAIGDAATRFQPVFGEGIRASFYSARFAAEAIERATKKKDFSKKSLELHDKLWIKKWGKSWDHSTLIYSVLYHSNDKQIDQFIGSLRKLDFGALWNLYLGKATIKDYMSMIRHLPDFMDKDTLWKIVKSH